MAPPIGAWLPVKLQLTIETVISALSNPVLIAPPYLCVAVLLIKVQPSIVPFTCTVVAPPSSALLFINVELAQYVPELSIHNPAPCPRLFLVIKVLFSNQQSVMLTSCPTVHLPAWIPAPALLWRFSVSFDWKVLFTKRQFLTVPLPYTPRPALAPPVQVPWLLVKLQFSIVKLDTTYASLFTEAEAQSKWQLSTCIFDKIRDLLTIAKADPATGTYVRLVYLKRITSVVYPLIKLRFIIFILVFVLLENNILPLCSASNVALTPSSLVCPP